MKGRVLRQRLDALEAESASLRQQVEKLSQTVQDLTQGRIMLEAVQTRLVRVYDDQNRIRAEIGVGARMGYSTDLAAVVLFDKTGRCVVMATEDEIVGGGTVAVVNEGRDRLSLIGGGYVRTRETSAIAHRQPSL